LANEARRVMVGGIGLPWRRDLDIGRMLIAELETLPVIVEDLSYSAHRVMHTLQEHEPDRLILVGSAHRGSDPPGTIRTYRPNHDFTDDDVIAMLGEAVGGVIDLDHTLVVNQFFGALPDDTVVIEIESGDEAFGLGYSEAVEAALPALRAAILSEIES
jgi:hydrogenase maturation protease